MKDAFLIIIPALVIALILGGISTFFYLRSNDLGQQLRQAQQMVQKMHEETRRIDGEKEKINQENEKLQADAISYVALNTDLQKEKDDLRARLKKAQDAITAKEQELKSASQKAKEIDKEMGKEKMVLNAKLTEEKTALEEKMQSLQETLRTERALYHYNLGVAYTEANLYDEAIEAYKRSLEFNPKNAEAHYNLGLLYENFNGDPGLAASHYRRYLELEPDAEDKEEVSGWIRRLK
jgi:tetratricopeptide (TPR) repeat protein